MYSKVYSVAESLCTLKSVKESGLLHDEGLFSLKSSETLSILKVRRWKSLGNLPSRVLTNNFTSFDLLYLQVLGIIDQYLIHVKTFLNI